MFDITDTAARASGSATLHLGTTSAPSVGKSSWRAGGWPATSATLQTASPPPSSPLVLCTWYYVLSSFRRSILIRTSINNRLPVRLFDQRAEGNSYKPLHNLGMAGQGFSPDVKKPEKQGL